MDVLVELVGFLSSLWIVGAVAFRFAVLRRAIGAEDAHARAASAAASMGIVGVALGAIAATAGVAKKAAAKHMAFGDAFAAGGSALVLQLAALVVLAAAFLAARRRVGAAWPVAAVAAGVLALRALAGGRLGGMVNPLHVAAASLWIGTLSVMVACGVAPMMRSAMSVAARESAVATMVRRFSTLALGAFALLGATGVITAWTHLKRVDALWTTAYGEVLVAKLAVVAVVAALGGWNWRRVGPALGAEGGARTIRNTAVIELAFAFVVLVLTGVLVTTPSPKAARPSGGHSPPAPAASAR